ncbi:hypothetical protein LWI28_015913 [Acer negundo]|uniref:Retrovirus-related Pol polyprotein from transposon TNT 1-94 n=1 Tax=Acer negundo TaxID=4023 RepID=A0AAD5JJV1_ACENE|nr:hypothetical protein LWI28_015913 [Acer negundo]
MASETFVQPAIPRFDGHYDHWSMLMENFLRSKEYWPVVVSEVVEPVEGESVSNYFSRAMAIINKMRIHGKKLEEVTIIEKILRSMTLKFNYVVCSIKESRDTDELSIEELQSSLLIHEKEMNRQGNEEQALQVSNKFSSLNLASRGSGEGK